jgi:hypothetical protein
MSRQTERRGEQSAGFVLVAVIMFVLALTIIVLSLFSVSGYEAGFLQRSQDAEQAFQSAAGGIERAKFALAETQLLESVSRDLPLEDVVAAVARQVQRTDTLEAGPVDWSATNPVHLRVTARVNGTSRTIEGDFAPASRRTYYSQVLTTSQGIAVDGPPGPGNPFDRTGTVDFTGPVWEGVSPSDSSQWWPLVGHTPDAPIIKSAIPDPDLVSYFALHPVDPLPQATLSYPGQQPTMDLTQAQYYASPLTNRDAYYNPSFNDPLTLQVRRLVVWEFPGGVRFDVPVEVSRHGGGPNACLVIVAGPSGDAQDAEAGIWFSEGLTVDPDVSLILVSSGKVLIQQLADTWVLSSSAPDIAVYARDVRLSGPRRAGGRTMALSHLPTGNLDTRFIPQLASTGALPNASSGSGRTLTLRAGSWRVSAP